jgi:hypothetical protein
MDIRCAAHPTKPATKTVHVTWRREDLWRPYCHACLARFASFHGWEYQVEPLPGEINDLQQLGERP